MRTKDKIPKRRKVNSTSVLALGFIAIIFIGTLLLMLPVSSARGEWTDPLTAGFTAVSATCVTGLVTVDTGSFFSTFGHTVILLLIQVGGLGFMTMAVLAALLFGKSVTPKDRMLVAASYNLNSSDSVLDLVKSILLGTAVIEGVGALALAFRFVPQFGWGRGIYVSIFTSVSAFCNAGFDVLGNDFASLTAYVSDPLVNITVMLLIITGGIGFIIWRDLYRLVTRKGHLSVYSKLVLSISAVLLLGGALLFAVFEWNNPETIGSLPTAEKIMASLFQSVTLRTAGFCTVDNGALTQNSEILGVILMFIGGAAGSTAGGVKVATVGVIFHTVWCVIRGKSEVVIFGRKISQDIFTRAVAAFAMQILLIAVGSVLIVAASGLDTVAVVYEVTSAVDTVGISMGLTPSFGTVPKIILMVLMYIGRVGFFTVSCAVMERFNKRSTSLTYPNANIIV